MASSMTVSRYLYRNLFLFSDVKSRILWLWRRGEKLQNCVGEVEYIFENLRISCYREHFCTVSIHCLSSWKLLCGDMLFLLMFCWWKEYRFLWCEHHEINELFGNEHESRVHFNAPEVYTPWSFLGGLHPSFVPLVSRTLHSTLILCLVARGPKDSFHLNWWRCDNF